MPGKMAGSDPRPSVRITRGAGSGQDPASILQEGRENANIDAGLFIWRISVESAERPAKLESADWDRLGCSGAAQCGGTAPKHSRRSSYTPRVNHSRDAPARSWCRIDCAP